MANTAAGLMRRRMMGARGSSIDWESIARGMVDNTTEFDIPASMAVMPENYQFVKRKVRSVVIDSNATSIGNSTFQTCTELTSIDIPDLVTTIGTLAFHQCSNLASVTFGRSIGTIGQQAFRDTNLTDITLPASLTKIENLAFYHCPLVKVVIEATTPPTLTNANSFNSNNTLFYVPDASVNDYKAANNWSSYASRIFPISDLVGGG